MDPQVTTVPPDITTPEAAYVFLERLGVADSLHMPTGQHSEAWRIAHQEARKAQSDTLSQASPRVPVVSRTLQGTGNIASAP